MGRQHVQARVPLGFFGEKASGRVVQERFDPQLPRQGDARAEALAQALKRRVEPMSIVDPAAKAGNAEHQLHRAASPVVLGQEPEVVAQRVDVLAKDEAKDVGLELGAREQHLGDLGVDLQAGRPGEGPADLGPVIVERISNAGEPGVDQAIEPLGLEKGDAVGADRDEGKACGAAPRDQPREVRVHRRLPADEIERGTPALPQRQRLSRRDVDHVLDVLAIEEPHVLAAAHVAVGAPQVAGRAGVDVRHREEGARPVAVDELPPPPDEVVPVLARVHVDERLGKVGGTSAGQPDREVAAAIPLSIVGAAPSGSQGRERHERSPAELSHLERAPARLREGARRPGVRVVGRGIGTEQLDDESVHAGAHEPPRSRGVEQQSAIRDHRDRGSAARAESSDHRSELRVEQRLAMAQNDVAAGDVRAPRILRVGRRRSHAWETSVVASRSPREAQEQRALGRPVGANGYARADARWNQRRMLHFQHAKTMFRTGRRRKPKLRGANALSQHLILQRFDRLRALMDDVPVRRAVDSLIADLLAPLISARPGPRGYHLVSWDAEQGICLTIQRNSTAILIELERRDDCRACLARTERFNVCARRPFDAKPLDAQDRRAVDQLVTMIRAREGALPRVERSPSSRRSMVRLVEVERVLMPEGNGHYYLNPYVGCTLGCEFCYVAERADFSRALEALPAVPWGRWVDAKINAPEVLRREIVSFPPGVVRLSPLVTDPYQPLERRLRITRACLEVLQGRGFTPVVLTRATLVLEDLPLLGRFPSAGVGFSIPTDDDRIRRHFEPGGDPIEERLAALRACHAAGLRTFAVIQPLLPMDPDRLVEAVAPYVHAVRVDRMYQVDRAAPLYARCGRPEASRETFFEEVGRRVREGFAQRGIPCDEFDDLSILLQRSSGTLKK